MPNQISNVGFTNPYAAEEEAIVRRRKMAEMLQQQADTPMGPTETIGGWAVKRSPLEGLAKMLQAYSGKKGQDEATEAQKALGTRYQSDLARTLMQAQQAGTGRPAVAGGAEDTGGGDIVQIPGQAAVGPDRQAMARILMGHPATQPLALQQMQQDLQRSGFMAAGGMGQGGGMPAGGPQGATGAPGAPQAGMAPAGAPNGFGGPAGGQPMAVWLQLDPTGKAYTEQLAKDYTERTKPQNVRPQGTIAVPDGKGGYTQAYYSAPVGEGMTRSPAGEAGVIPGYLEGQAALGKTPMTQVTNADQTRSYIPNAQLAGAAMASPIPQAPQAPAVPRAAAIPSPAGFPRESPAEKATAMEGRLRILNSELADAQAKLADPRAVQQDKEIAQQNIVALQKEIAGTPGGRAAPAGPPKFGQTQEEQIKQTADTAAAKTEAEERARLRVEMPEARLRIQSQHQDLDRIAGAASEIITRNLARATGPLGAMPSFPGGGAAQVEALVSSLKAQVSGMKLQAMRDASKTGGAVGNVTEKEWPRLENMIVALDPVKMGPAMFRKKLFELTDQIRQVKTQLQNAFDTQYKASAPGTTGGLNDAEQTELQQLRARFGRR